MERDGDMLTGGVVALGALLAVGADDVGGGGRGVVRDLDATRSPFLRLPLVMTISLRKEWRIDGRGNIV